MALETPGRMHAVLRNPAIPASPARAPPARGPTAPAQALLLLSVRVRAPLQILHCAARARQAVLRISFVTDHREEEEETEWLTGSRSKP